MKHKLYKFVIDEAELRKTTGTDYITARKKMAALRKARKDAGQCINCGSTELYVKTRCQPCSWKHLMARNAAWEKRQIALKHFRTYNTKRKRPKGAKNVGKTGKSS